MSGVELPWGAESLVEWKIVGMNHYTGYNGDECLYIAMVKDGKCITIRGKDNFLLWDKLAAKVKG